MFWSICLLLLFHLCFHNTCLCLCTCMPLYLRGHYTLESDKGCFHCRCLGTTTAETAYLLWEVWGSGSWSLMLIWPQNRVFAWVFTSEMEGRKWVFVDCVSVRVWKAEVLCVCLFVCVIVKMRSWGGKRRSGPCSIVSFTGFLFFSELPVQRRLYVRSKHYRNYTSLQDAEISMNCQ